MNEKKFKKLIKNNEFLEHARVFKNLYGTSKKFVVRNLKKGKNVLFDIDWQGADKIKKKKIKFQIIDIFYITT